MTGPVAWLGRAASAASTRLGRQSGAVRAARPLFEWALDVLTLGRGVSVVVNGAERFRVDPHHRSHLPTSYEPEAFAFLRSRVRAGDVVLNVGANVGLYALCLGRWVGPAGRVFAFEPAPDARRLLEKHVRLNGLGDRVEVVASAVSDRVGTAEFFAAGMEGTNRLDAPNPDAPGAAPIAVPVTSIDRFCEDRGVRPDWIVVDVEGHEAAVLRGARETISAAGRVRIVAEMHPSLWLGAGEGREAMARTLADLGLTAVPLQGQRDPLGEYGIVAFEGGHPSAGGRR